MNEQILMIVCIFGAVSMVAYFASRVMLGNPTEDKLRSRLSHKPHDPVRSDAPAQTSGNRLDVVPLMKRVSEAAAQPFMPKTREKQSSIRQGLARAGIYSPSAARVMIGAKVLMLFVGLGAGYAVGRAIEMLMLGLSLGGLIGYLAPSMWLKFAAAGNQKALQHGLADALDLMVVCVEAGLTVDAAMQRVGQELAIAHPAISRELGIAHMETRVGLSRADSLKNLGTRTGCEALQQVAAMLIQADRFGTSIAQALRVQAETLRLKRQHAAEEQAAKASVKMTFPLVLFIFPSTFIVLVGPTVIELMKSDLMK